MNSLGITFNEDYLDIPSLSPSNSTSTVTTTTEYHDSLDVKQCKLIKKNALLSPNPTLTTDNKKSPAALFLSRLSCSPVVEQDEEDVGDQIDNYVIDDIIGYGGFSVVRKAFIQSKPVAMKIINKSDLIQQELIIWKLLNHPHILELHEILETRNKLFIISEYCDSTLLNHLLSRKSLLETEARVIFKELCQAVHYLHSNQICHKDLKLENVLLIKNKVRLIDFGLAIHCQQPSKSMAGGSLAYASPEQIKSKFSIPHPSTDIWSLGVILYTLVVGRLPFHDGFELRLQQKILQGQYSIPTHLSTPLQHLIHGCLELDPTKRWSIQHILNSSWITL